MTRLPASFYQQTNVVKTAQQLLGKLLVTNFNGQKTSGRIVETEAYRAPDDKACHAYGNKKTSRTKVMFMEGGTAYITLCYGIHHLFNVVTGSEGTAQAVLIRGIEPVEGIEVMLQRRNIEKLISRLTAGPGALSKALGVTTDWHGSSLTAKDSNIWLEETDISYTEHEIIASPRVGINYAEEWKDTPWRFRVKNNAWTSPAK